MVNGEKARNVLHIGIPVASKVQWEPHVKACLALFFFLSYWLTRGTM